MGRIWPKQSSKQHFTNIIEICTIALILNLLLAHVVLTQVTTRNFESTNFFTVKLLHTNNPVCHFEISTQRFRLAIVVGLMQQFYFIIGSIVCIRSPAVASKGYGKSSDLCIEHCPLECVKTWSWVLFKCS